MIYIRPFKKEDFLAFKPIEPLPEEEIYDEVLAQQIEDSGLAVTGIRDGKVVGCGGVHPQIDTSQGEIWLRISRECLRFKIESLITLKKALAIIEEVYPFERLNAVVKSRFKQSNKLAQYLGFTLAQSVMHNGEEWDIYTKLVSGEKNDNKNSKHELKPQGCI